MAALGFARPGGRPTVLSVSSVEATRRNGNPSDDVSLAVEEAERAAGRAADFVLTPDWLCRRAAAELGLADERVRPFPMEGRLPNEWEAPLDYGHVKMEIGVGPLDRLLLFVGPVEHAAGVDLLVEALPVMLQRAPQLRIGFVGEGGMRGGLQHRAWQMGVGHAVRFLGHVEGSRLARLLRASEALVLPSRYRVPFDDAVVDLARRAGRPVVTTHGGPAHLVRHEENGVVTYDNPGSMVWALDRILGDAGHAERMGRNGRRDGGDAPVWGDVARCYLDLCMVLFPGLTETALNDSSRSVMAVFGRRKYILEEKWNDDIDNPTSQTVSCTSPTATPPPTATARPSAPALARPRNAEPFQLAAQPRPGGARGKRSCRPRRRAARARGLLP